jgi:hypothetical protein
MLYGVYIPELDDFEIKLLGKKVRRSLSHLILSSRKIFSKKEKLHAHMKRIYNTDPSKLINNKHLWKHKNQGSLMGPPWPEGHS